MPLGIRLVSWARHLVFELRRSCVANVYAFCGVLEAMGRAYWREPIARPLRVVSLAIDARGK